MPKRAAIDTSNGTAGHCREVRGTAAGGSTRPPNFRFDNPGQKMFNYWTFL